MFSIIVFSPSIGHVSRIVLEMTKGSKFATVRMYLDVEEGVKY